MCSTPSYKPGGESGRDATRQHGHVRVHVYRGLDGGKFRCSRPPFPISGLSACGTVSKPEISTYDLAYRINKTSNITRQPLKFSLSEKTGKSRTVMGHAKIRFLSDFLFILSSCDSEVHMYVTPRPCFDLRPLSMG